MILSSDDDIKELTSLMGRLYVCSHCVQEVNSELMILRLYKQKFSLDLRVYILYIPVKFRAFLLFAVMDANSW